MPSSANYLPRASQAPQLGAGATEEYRETGWRISEFGRVNSDTVAGPCATCRALCWRYGAAGRPLCYSCERET